MTIDEAINHVEEVANENKKIADTRMLSDGWSVDAMYCDDTECADEHIARCRQYSDKCHQLAEWLKDYKRLLEQKPKIGHCKDCKYFEYDSVAKVNGIPLIVAHEICSRWGNGCKTKEDGYCFLFEPKAESEEV